MGQLIFFALFFIALIAGIFSYFPGAQKPINPLAFISDQSGYTSVEERNRKSIEQANITTNQGLTQVRRQIQYMAQRQKYFSDMLAEQERLLNATGKQAGMVLAQAQQAAEKEGKDILGFKDLAMQLQNQQSLLIENGQALIALNNQIIRDRDWIHDQIDLIDANNETTQQMKLQGQYATLNTQSSVFFNKVTQYNQQVQQYMQEVLDKLNDTANHIAYDSSQQQQAVREKIRSLMDKQHEDMLQLSENRQKSQNIMRDQERSLALSQELLNNAIRHTKQAIEQECQKAKEKQRQLQQEIQDQKDRVRDKQ